MNQWGKVKYPALWGRAFDFTLPCRFDMMLLFFISEQSSVLFWQRLHDEYRYKKHAIKMSTEIASIGFR